jgi:hypothetical protein
MARSSFIIMKKSKSVDKYFELKELKNIFIIKNKHGYRRITDELNNQGVVINHKTILRLMKSLG